MKPSGSIKTMMASMLILGIITNIIYCNKMLKNEEQIQIESLFAPAIEKKKLVGDSITETVVFKDNNPPKEERPEEVPTEPERVVVYDNMTMEELTAKLDRVLSSDLAGMGQYYAKYAIELGVDPYLAVAISMHETGCSWDCSYLTKVCNNIGGQKGTGCGEYQAYSSLDEGIYEFIANIKRNYVDYGLLTAEEMNSKYAEDQTWSSKVNNYIDIIKNS